jgi:GTP pyrophosphokinase
VDVAIEAADRQELLRDISAVFTKEKMNVIGVQTRSPVGRQPGHRPHDFTVSSANGRLKHVICKVAEVAGE